jgi:hypothetical protein
LKTITSFSLALCLLTGFNVSAQIADNFEVTDIYGQTHSLYQDHLNLGEAMILGFFYVGAPLVDELYPQIQNLMNTSWDSLPADILLMSEADNTAELIAFANELQLDLSLVPNEGGAGSAMAPYVGGEFGTFYGYPMFVVIGPDGTVIFDPWGYNETEIIASIQDALYQVLNITSVANVSAQKIEVSSSNGRLQVMNPGISGLQLDVFGLSGRGMHSQLLSNGTNDVDLSAEGVVLYRLSAPGLMQSGKAWIGH